MALQYFSEVRTNPYRALQLYQILIGLAYNRQTMTYGQLAEVVGFKGAGVFAAKLGHIMFWCDQEALPPLTVLIVNQETGLPGEGLTTPEDLHSQREEVFNHPWYDLVPPTVAELEAAFQRAS
jgi:hypothetical protein